MRNVSGKFVEKITKYTLYVQKSPPPENRANYEIMYKKCCGDMEATDDNIIHDRKCDLNAG